MKEVDHTGCKDTRVNKINNLHNSHRRAEVVHCKKGGTSGDVLQSSQWYFHMLDFLYNLEIPIGSTSSMHTNNGARK
jgi:hypothetical protein